MMAEMTLAGRRPLNWNVLTIDSREPERYRDQLAACENAFGARRQGRRADDADPRRDEHVVPQLLRVVHAPRVERSHEPPGARARREAQGSIGAAVDERPGPVAGGRRVLAARVVGSLHDRRHLLGRERRASRAKSSPRSPSATNRGTFDTLLDIVINDDLSTVLWPLPSDSDLKSWQMRAEAWDHPLVMIGGSDAGAHLDRMCGAPYTTSFLADSLRGRQLVSLERCVQLMTSDAGAALRPARPRASCRRATAPTCRVRPRDGRDRRGQARRRPARRHEPAVRGRDRRPARHRQRHADRDRRRRRPTPAPAPSCAAAATPTPSRSPPTPDPRAFLREFAPVSGG